jgi:hypothetical protein
MSNFGKWTLIKLDKRFKLKQVKHLTALKNWLASQTDISDQERSMLLFFQGRSLDMVDNWNEQEYALNVIGPILSITDFTTEESNFFAERALAGIVDGEELNGVPDGIIAKGRREPEIPYFCLQEWKREKDPDGDPAGQCLAAMLVAQELNQNQHPVYGCYTLGRNWFFMALQGREYAISNSYTVTRDDIFDIFRILRGLRAMIAEWIAQDNDTITHRTV